MSMKKSQVYIELKEFSLYQRMSEAAMAQMKQISKPPLSSSHVNFSYVVYSVKLSSNQQRCQQVKSINWYYLSFIREVIQSFYPNIQASQSIQHTPQVIKVLTPAFQTIGGECPDLSTASKHYSIIYSVIHPFEVIMKNSSIQVDSNTYYRYRATA
jgi:hypothetical protein